MRDGHRRRRVTAREDRHGRCGVVFAEILERGDRVGRYCVHAVAGSQGFFGCRCFSWQLWRSQGVGLRISRAFIGKQGMADRAGRRARRVCPVKDRGNIERIDRRERSGRGLVDLIKDISLH